MSSRPTSASRLLGSGLLGLGLGAALLIAAAAAAEEDRAEREAAREFQAAPQSDGQTALASRLLQRYRAEIAKAHGLSAEQLEEIQAEGFEKNWKVVLQ